MIRRSGADQRPPLSGHVCNELENGYLPGFRCRRWVHKPTSPSKRRPPARGDLAGVFRRIAAKAREGIGGEGERLRPLQLCARRFPNLYRITHFDRPVAVYILPAIVVVIVMVIVMVVAMSRGHVEVTMVLMPVSLADANADADVADLNSDVFRDDHWFVASAQRAGKCRHR
jgi:hypothetical protein